MLDIIYLIAGILFIIVLLFALFMLVKINKRLNFIKQQEKLIADFIENNAKFIKVLDKLNLFFSSYGKNDLKEKGKSKSNIAQEGFIDVITNIDKHQDNIKKIISKGRSLFGKKDK